MSRSDNTDWHRRRGNSNRPAWRDAADWNTWRTDRGNWGHKHHWWEDPWPPGASRYFQRRYWKTDRMRVRQALIPHKFDPWDDDAPYPTRTRNTVKYWFTS